LRAAFGFAAAFVFVVFFAVFFRAIGMGSNSSSAIEETQPRVSEHAHDEQLMDESQLTATTSSDTEKTRALETPQNQANLAFIRIRIINGAHIASLDHAVRF
jgi:hypothetical protein